jgi:hypothetical protein
MGYAFGRAVQRAAHVQNAARSVGRIFPTDAKVFPLAAVRNQGNLGRALKPSLALPELRVLASSIRGGSGSEEIPWRADGKTCVGSRPVSLPGSICSIRTSREFTSQSPKKWTATELNVIGEIPKDLHGAYYRNGPNPVHAPQAMHHWFDGDGMLHAIYFENGKAEYRNRYVRSDDFKAELAGNVGAGGVLLPANPRARKTKSTRTPPTPT